MGYVTDQRFRISKLVRTSVGTSIGSAAPLKVLASTLILLVSSGCATAWARGIVRDETGKEVSGAEVAVTAIGADMVGARGESESNGCFNVTARCKGSRRCSPGLPGGKL